MSMVRTNRAVTPEAFGKFLRWLSEDDEQAAREYLQIRKKLIRYFINKGCDDPDSLFDETVDITVGKIEMCAECPIPLAYCYGVARNVWRQHRFDRKPVPLDQELASSENPALEIQEQEMKCLERCLSQLSPGDRDIVTRYYEGQASAKIEIRRLLGAEHGGQNALRIRTCRIRRDLGTCVVECIKRSVN